MKSKLCILGILATMILLGCKTNENNYRQAYEKTMARDSLRTDFNETVYGRYRREVREVENVQGSDTARVTVARVSVTPNGGAVRENLKKYNVVVAGFKQLLNASSMRERFVDGGYPGAFIVQTPEPYYYVVAGSFRTLGEAIALRDTLTATSPVPLRSPHPFILVPTQLNRP